MKLKIIWRIFAAISFLLGAMRLLGKNPDYPLAIISLFLSLVFILNSYYVKDKEKK